MIVDLDAGTVIGKQVNLRFVRASDAEFLLDLRTDERLNRHVSPVAGGLEEQSRWIDAYEAREARGAEYYFIILAKAGLPVGTVRLYDFRGDTFSWGSWIIRRGTPAFAAVESAILVYRLAFEHLGFHRARFSVRKGNRAVDRFHRRWGATVVREDEDSYHYSYEKEDFYAILPEYDRRLD